MSQMLSDEYITVTREAITAEINTKQLEVSSDESTQKLIDGGILEVILLQAMIPFLVSLTSSVLAEIIKNKMLSSMKRHEVEMAIDELRKQPVNPKVDLDDECFVEALNVLTPFGLSEVEIIKIYAIVKQKSDNEGN
ncbi:MAG: hypothetical protein QNJ51_17640 [Calothrix sp. MO_167.B12]|nr:hypothetical protein [Calothrix sp. MO_167.B12]